MHTKTLPKGLSAFCGPEGNPLRPFLRLPPPEAAPAVWYNWITERERRPGGDAAPPEKGMRSQA